MVKFFYYPNLNLFQIFATILWSIKKNLFLKNQSYFYTYMLKKQSKPFHEKNPNYLLPLLLTINTCKFS